MNLAVLVHVYDPHGGGAERSTAQIVTQLIARGHKVTVITGYCPDGVEIPGAGPGAIDRYYTRFPKSPWWVWRFTDWAAKRVAQGQFDSSLSVASTLRRRWFSLVAGPSVKRSIAISTCARGRHRASVSGSCSSYQ